MLEESTEWLNKKINQIYNDPNLTDKDTVMIHFFKKIQEKNGQNRVKY